jgi:glycosyltransferase involved in cell wall biosynthesis
VKIVHLIWGLGVGGSETMLTDIANVQSGRHRVWVVIGNADVDPSIVSSLNQRVKTVLLGRPPGSGNPWFVAKLLAMLWNIRPDVIHVHHESFIRLKRLMPAPLVLTVHGTGDPLSPAVAAFDQVCCISEAVRKFVGATTGVANPVVVHNGVSFSSIPRKARYGGAPFRMVQVGRLEHGIKGQDLLVEAVQRVNGLLGEGAVEVDFIGDGSSREFLTRLAAERGVQKFCHFLGAESRDAIYTKLRDYDLLVQPSRSEGFGLTIVEGIAAGLPVLVSDVEGPREIIDGGRLGDSFRSGDSRDLAERIAELVRQSALPSFGQAMRVRTERANARFDVSLTAQRYLDQYGKLVHLQ